MLLSVVIEGMRGTREGLIKGSGDGVRVLERG